jgi:Transcription factor WhiB
VRYVMGTSGDLEPSAQPIDRALAAEVTRKARCADGTLDPDEWFPVSTEAEAARREAADAIAICTACPVRGACLELSLRHWTIGQHGVWGGLVAADRAALRRRWLASPHEYGRALSILDRIWDGPPATSHARRMDRAATAAGTSRRALSSMRAVRMARAMLRHLTAATATARDQAPPGGRRIPPAASVPQMGAALARRLPAVDAADAGQRAHARPADTGARRPGSRPAAGSARVWPIQAGTAVRRRADSRSRRAARSGGNHGERDTRPSA